MPRTGSIRRDPRCETDIMNDADIPKRVTWPDESSDRPHPEAAATVGGGAPAPSTEPCTDMVTVADSIVDPVSDKAATRRRRRVVRDTAGAGSRPRPSRWMLAALGSIAIVLAQVDGPRTSPLPEAEVETSLAGDETPPPPPPETSTLIIRTVPSEARVAIDGSERGTTPLIILDLTVGRYQLVLEGASGRIERTVTIDADDTTAVVETLIAGWAATFSRVRLDIYRSGRLLGSTEGGHVMLPRGDMSWSWSMSDWASGPPTCCRSIPAR